MNISVRSAITLYHSDSYISALQGYILSLLCVYRGLNTRRDLTTVQRGVFISYTYLDTESPSFNTQTHTVLLQR